MDTKAQSECQLWFQLRKVRITSSKAHSVFRRKGNFGKLAQARHAPKPFKSKSVAYGIRMEPIAKRKFQSTNGVEIVNSGLFICPGENWLCASPDGLVKESNDTYSVLEVKCPFSCKKKEIVDFRNMKSNVSYLHFVNGDLQLKKSHSYYTQIQITMFCSSTNCCYLYVYSSAQQIQINIPKDSQFFENCVKVQRQFYFKYYLQLLVN